MQHHRPVALPDGPILLPDGLASAAGEGGDLPTWDLSDLYAGTDDPRIEADLARLGKDSQEFAAKHAGTLAGLSGAALARLIVEFERIEEGLGRLASFAQLRFAADSSDPASGQFYQMVTERVTAINSDLIFFGLEINRMDDAALEAKRRGVFLIGISSRGHAEGSAPDHPARHPTRQNLHDLVDIAIDTKVEIGDAVVRVPGFGDPIAAISTFANACALNCLTIRVVAKLVAQGVEPPVWRSGNSPGGDAANARFIALFQDRVRAL
jgi:hypothetical protein